MNNFRKQIKKRNLDLPGLQEMLPCALDAVDHLDEIYIAGKSKFESEVESAKNIPSQQRRLLDKSAINIGGIEKEEIIAEQYDANNTYLM